MEKCVEISFDGKEIIEMFSKEEQEVYNRALLLDVKRNGVYGVTTTWLLNGNKCVTISFDGNSIMRKLSNEYQEEYKTALLIDAKEGNNYNTLITTWVLIHRRKCEKSKTSSDFDKSVSMFENICGLDRETARKSIATVIDGFDKFIAYNV